MFQPSRVARHALSILLLLLGLARVVGSEPPTTGTFAPAPGAEYGVELVDALRYERLSLRIRVFDLERDRAIREFETRERELTAERERLDADWRAKYGLGVADTVRDGEKFRRRGDGKR